jgi:hypothetical protein
MVGRSRPAAGGRRRRGAHLGTLLALLLKGPYDAGVGLGRATDGRLLREVLGTTYGRALDARSC